LRVLGIQPAVLGEVFADLVLEVDFFVQVHKRVSPKTPKLLRITYLHDSVAFRIAR